MDAIEKFRSVFGSEAIVEILEAGDNKIIARFSGNMCYTCGAVDYFDDFALMFSDCAGEQWGVESYVQNSDGSYTVVFKPKRLLRGSKRHVKIVIYDEEFNYTAEA